MLKHDSNTPGVLGRTVVDNETLESMPYAISWHQDDGYFETFPWHRARIRPMTEAEINNFPGELPNPRHTDPYVISRNEGIIPKQIVAILPTALNVSSLSQTQTAELVDYLWR